MREVTVRLNSEGTSTAKVLVGGGATHRRISPRNALKIQEFVNNNRVEVTLVGSRVDPSKVIVPGISDWDYLINECQGMLPRKSLREIAGASRRYLPGGRPRTDAFGNARSGMDTERNVPVQIDKPYVVFRPE
jgi:hypothetical protein